jgi:hypothetical protein
MARHPAGAWMALPASAVRGWWQPASKARIRVRFGAQLRFMHAATPANRIPRMATVDQTMLKVQRLLTGPCGLRIQLQGDLISVAFSNVSTELHLSVVDWGKTKDGEPRTLVHITSPILRGVTPTPALYEFLAREAQRYWFGHVQVFDDANNKGMVTLQMSHTLLGDYLDEEELKAAMFGVMDAADEQDDLMQQRFGGKRWKDE